MALSAALKAKNQPQVTPITIVIGDSVYLYGAVTADGVVQDFTSCTCTADILVSDGGAVLLTFTASVPTPLSGIVLMTLTPTQTNSISATVTTDGQQIGVWAGKISDGTDTVTFTRGPVFALFKRI